MSSPLSARPIRMIVVTFIAGLMLAACGVPVDDQPERIDVHGLESYSSAQP